MASTLGCRSRAARAVLGRRRSGRELPVALRALTCAADAERRERIERRSRRTNYHGDAVAPTLRLRWWCEVAIVASFYGIYTAVRNLFGSASVSPDHALENARQIIRVERAIGLFHEETVQHWFLGWSWFMWFWNMFYGTFHFLVTIAVLLYLFHRVPERYRQWRNTLAATTALALIGFSLYPLMPPRLLSVCGEYGGCTDSNFVDTLQRFGGLWSFDSGTMQSISNQYAAMPSLHFAWSTWCWLAPSSGRSTRSLRIALAASTLAHPVRHRGHGQPLLDRRRRRGSGSWRSATLIGSLITRARGSLAPVAAACRFAEVPDASATRGAAAPGVSLEPMQLLESIREPADLKRLTNDELITLADELRQAIVGTVSSTGRSPGLEPRCRRADAGAAPCVRFAARHHPLGHRPPGVRPQAGHRPLLRLRARCAKHGGLSGYPSRSESEHDWIENSHASTVLGYAHGLATRCGRRVTTNATSSRSSATAR